MSKLFLYGAGGHAKVVAEIAELNGYEHIVFCEDEPTKDKLLGYEVVAILEEDGSCLIAIGNNAVRKKLAQSLSNRFVQLVHPQTNLSPRSNIGEGTVVMAGVTINADATVGEHCIINTNASVDHDCVIEDYVHLSPNVALAGNVTIGEGTHIGIGACVIQGVKVGRWCTVGAGAVVIRDVPDGATVVGNPARNIKQKEL
ncbi:MAG TPA: acetyltransferase [Sphingobacterium bovisgrunnientis]|nr:acetyltransferase [Sphingobacterium bovisgrunnientis]